MEQHYSFICQLFVSLCIDPMFLHIKMATRMYFWAIAKVTHKTWPTVDILFKTNYNYKGYVLMIFLYYDKGISSTSNFGIN